LNSGQQKTLTSGYLQVIDHALNSIDSPCQFFRPVLVLSIFYCPVQIDDAVVCIDVNAREFDALFGHQRRFDRSGDIGVVDILACRLPSKGLTCAKHQGQNCHYCKAFRSSDYNPSSFQILYSG